MSLGAYRYACWRSCPISASAAPVRAGRWATGWTLCLSALATSELEFTLAFARAAHRASRSRAFIPQSALVLVPTGDTSLIAFRTPGRRRSNAQSRLSFHFDAGDGSCAHLEKQVSLPNKLRLTDGLYEVGREKPADIVIAIPTISSRHAMIRVGEPEVAECSYNSLDTSVRSKVGQSCPQLRSWSTSGLCAVAEQLLTESLRFADGKSVNITDLNSTNGTYLDSDALTPMKAQEVPIGSEVTFGECPAHLSDAGLTGSALVASFSCLVPHFYLCWPLQMRHLHCQERNCSITHPCRVLVCKVMLTVPWGCLCQRQA